MNPNILMQGGSMKCISILKSDTWNIEIGILFYSHAEREQTSVIFISIISCKL
jgi:hypothetical protein